jgi:hypothetical protein
VLVHDNVAAQLKSLILKKSSVQEKFKSQDCER